MVDVEAAFLNSELDQVLYIELPDLFPVYCEETGLSLPEDPVAQVIMSQYGCVQSARLWFLKFKSILVDDKEVKQCLSEPCIFYKRMEGMLVLIVVIYCDDALLLGTKKEVQKVKDRIKGHINITEMGLPKRHLGIGLTRGSDELGTFWEMNVERSIEEIVKDYEKDVGKSVSIFVTPGTPGKVMKKNEGELIKQGDYRSYVGRILYPVKKCIPDCINAIRELCGHLENPGEDQWAALTRLVGYLKGNYKPMKLRAPRELRAGGNSDATWGSDPNDRKSISCGLTHID